MTADRACFLGDWHAPYHDPQALGAAFRFLASYRPTRIYLLGDLIDCYSLSRFCRDPARRTALADDLSTTRELLRQLRQAAPSATVIYLQGNHEARPVKYVWNRAPELACLGLTMPEMLRLKDLGISYVEDGVTVRRGCLLVKHGHVVRQHAGYSARGELDKCGISGVSGHTHRLALIHRRTFAGVMSWAEAGCLCLLDPGYLEGQIADWQHGLVYGVIGNRPSLHLAPIHKGKICP